MSCYQTIWEHVGAISLNVYQVSAKTPYRDGSEQGEVRIAKSMSSVTLLRVHLGPYFTSVRNTGRKPRYGLYVARTGWLR